MTRDLVEDTVKDLVETLLWSGRKDDEELPKGAIEEMVAAGAITREWIAEVFRAELFNKLGRHGVKTSTVAGGRVAVYLPGHPGANNRGYVPRSRHVVEQALGRLLSSDEEVHHKNEDPSNDRLENLEVRSKSDHALLHYPKRKEQGFGTPRRLDYDQIAAMMASGLGYRKIASILSEPVYSVRYVCRTIRGRNLAST